MIENKTLKDQGEYDANFIKEKMILLDRFKMQLKILYKSDIKKSEFGLVHCLETAY